VPKIYVIHENDAWVEPLRAAFAALDLPFEEWFLSEGRLDLDEVPPEGVFYNRMSASSHTRGDRYAAELTGAVLAWLELHGRRVVNNGRRAARDQQGRTIRRARGPASARRAPSPRGRPRRNRRRRGKGRRPVHHQAQPRGRVWG
jgi:hypothetical protein